MSELTSRNWSSILVDRYVVWLVTPSGPRTVPNLFGVLLSMPVFLLGATWGGLSAYQAKRYGALVDNCIQFHSKNGLVTSISIHLFATIDAGVIAVSILMLLSGVAFWSTCMERLNEN